MNNKNNNNQTQINKRAIYQIKAHATSTERLDRSLVVALLRSHLQPQSVHAPLRLCQLRIGLLAMPHKRVHLLLACPHFFLQLRNQLRAGGLLLVELLGAGVGRFQQLHALMQSLYIQYKLAYSYRYRLYTVLLDLGLQFGD